MANVDLVLTVKMAWWVAPYLGAAALFVRSIAPFVDIDDEQIEAFSKKQGAFIAKHGVRFYIGGKRV